MSATSQRISLVLVNHCIRTVVILGVMEQQLPIRVDRQEWLAFPLETAADGRYAQ